MSDFIPFSNPKTIEAIDKLFFPKQDSNQRYLPKLSLRAPNTFIKFTERHQHIYVPIPDLVFKVSKVVKLADIQDWIGEDDPLSTDSQQFKDAIEDYAYELHNDIDFSGLEIPVGRSIDVDCHIDLRGMDTSEYAVIGDHLYLRAEFKYRVYGDGFTNQFEELDLMMFITRHYTNNESTGMTEAHVHTLDGTMDTIWHDGTLDSTLLKNYLLHERLGKLFTKKKETHSNEGGLIHCNADFQPLSELFKIPKSLTNLDSLLETFTAQRRYHDSERFF
ncbi:hypothetical protein QTV43_000030 [Vibrio vulnificus]|nr:hypothetical protein [Vibrio vulnificus]